MAPKAPIQSAKSSSVANQKKGKHSARKAGPKPPLGVSERLNRLFTSLCAQIDGGHFNNALKTCDKILRLEPNDVDAVQTKLFLLLQTEQYQPVLSLIEHEGNQDHAFERSYSYYRLQREEEARQILTTIKDEKGDDDRGVMHLEAQLCYREGLYQEAVELYNQLLDTAERGSEEHSDILTNLQASQKHLDFIETGFLQALDRLPLSMTKNIESNPPPVQPSTHFSATLALTSASAEPGKPPVKKTRMSRVPAGVVPGVTPPPDPERWLKKSERSVFNHGKRRKGPGGGGGATQGSANVDVAAPSTGSTASHSTKSGSKRKPRK